VIIAVAVLLAVALPIIVTSLSPCCVSPYDIILASFALVDCSGAGVAAVVQYSVTVAIVRLMLVSALQENAKWY
jgi:hypothetical protein